MLLLVLQVLFVVLWAFLWLLLVGIVADEKKQLICFEGFRVVYLSLGGGGWFILPEIDTTFDEFVLAGDEDEDKDDDDDDGEDLVVFFWENSLFIVSAGNCVFCCWLLLLLLELFFNE